MTSPDFPTLIVELLLGVSPQSTYFVLDDPVRGAFDNPYGYGFAPDSVWFDVSADVRTVDINRGRLRSIDQMQAGTATIVLDDNAGNYNLGATSGPYTSGGVSMLQPNVKVRIRATWHGTTYPLYVGYIDALTPGYSDGQYSDTELTITCTDFFKVMQNTLVPAAVINGGVGLTLTNWVDFLLLNAGYSGNRVQFYGEGTNLYMSGTSSAGTLLDAINAAVATDMGRVYIDTNGTIVVDSRYMRYAAFTDNGVAGTFTDQTSSGLIYESAVVAFDDTLVYNSVTGTRTGGADQTSTDATSISTNWTRQFTNSDVFFGSDADVKHQFSDYVLYAFKNAELRVDQITVHPLGDASLWPHVLQRAIGDVIGVQVSPPHASQWTANSFIEGVSHTITATGVQDWHTTWSLSNAAAFITGWLIFDDNPRGELDTGSFAA